MPRRPSALETARQSYEPKHPEVLRRADVAGVEETSGRTAVDDTELGALFPHTFGAPLVALRSAASSSDTSALRVGVVLSGGQAPGGHNVLAGLLDGLEVVAPGSSLIGFLGGPGGILADRAIELDAAALASYRNTGGFDRIGSGRDKIETPEQLASSASTCRRRELDGLVVVGGDDSNTNAAVLAEHFAGNGLRTAVVGVPKTIDGDLRTDDVELSFGFDTATKVYSELIGNIARDAASAGKYWHFVKLMGRSASHVTLECALATQPNIALIGEEVRAERATLDSIVRSVADVVASRAAAGRTWGVCLIPEGLIEFIPEVGSLMERLNLLLAEPESGGGEASREAVIRAGLAGNDRELFDALPESIARQLLLDRDAHGNVQVSKIDTEKLLVELVGRELSRRRESGEYSGTFSTQAHFFGYEGRCAAPTNFDADYTYTLGRTAAVLISRRKTGVMAAVRGLAGAPSSWVPLGVPIASLLHFETRKGARKPVIRKALVELDGPAFHAFAGARSDWANDDAYVHPGAIQYFGPPAISEARPLSLVLERG